MAKQLNTRIQLKHDFEENWITAGNESFVPKSGEVIIYDAEVDSNGSRLTIDDKFASTPTARRPRIKIGDGQTNVNDLEFVSNDNIKSSKIFENLTLPEIGENIYFKPIDPDWVISYEESNIKKANTDETFRIYPNNSQYTLEVKSGTYYTMDYYYGKRRDKDNYTMPFALDPLQEYLSSRLGSANNVENKVEKTFVDNKNKRIDVTFYCNTVGISDDDTHFRCITTFKYADDSEIPDSLILYPEIRYSFENVTFSNKSESNATLLKNVYKYKDKQENWWYTLDSHYTPNQPNKHSNSYHDKLTPDNDTEKMLHSIQLEALFNGGEKYSHGENNYVTIQGKDVVANGEGSVSIGQENLALQANAIALGEKNLIRSENGFSAGHNTIVTGKRGAAINDGAYALGYASFASGGDTRALGDYSVAEGTDTVAEGYNSHAEGRVTKATGDYSHAENYYTTAKGTGSHAEGGRDTIAMGDYSHAEGLASVAEGGHSHAEGNCTHALANAHSEGRGTTASGYISHAEGYCSVANGEQSHAEGYGSYTNGKGAHAEGVASIFTIKLSGEANATTYSCDDVSKVKEKDEIQYQTSLVKVISTNPTANLVTVDKTLSKTAISNKDVQVIRDRVQALGQASHAEGTSTIAASSNQHVQGRYNKIDDKGKYAHIVGNGTSTERSDAHTLDWDGNAWFAGNVISGGNAEFAGKITAGAAPTNEMDLTTKKYVDEHISEAINNASPKMTSSFFLCNSQSTEQSDKDMLAANTHLLLIDTNPTDGGLKYYNGEDWVTVPVRFS